jgi:hypothetical protein
MGWRIAKNRLGTYKFVSNGGVPAVPAVQIGATASAALLIGAGTAAAPYTSSLAGKNFLGFWTKSTATSGDSRGLYLRHYISGAGGAGDACRIFATATAAVSASGSMTGAHITAAVATGGSIGGQATAVRATFQADTGTTPGGTLSSLICESYVASGVSLPTSHAFIRFVDTGTVAFTRLFSVPNVASGGLFAAHTTQTMTHSLRIRTEGGTVYYLMCTNAADNRTGGA